MVCNLIKNIDLTLGNYTDKAPRVASAGKRKSPIMLLNWSPVLGRGTSKSVQQPAKQQRASQRLNMPPGKHSCFVVFLANVFSWFLMVYWFVPLSSPRWILQAGAAGILTYSLHFCNFFVGCSKFKLVRFGLLHFNKDFLPRNFADG